MLCNSHTFVPTTLEASSQWLQLCVVVHSSRPGHFYAFKLLVVVVVEEEEGLGIGAISIIVIVAVGGI